jgi:cell division protein FtsL
MSAFNAAAAPRREPARRPEIAPVERSGRRLRVTTVLACTLALVVLFGLVGFQALIVRNQGTLDDLDARIDAASRTNERMRLQVAELEAPERIRAIATTVLGMVVPENVEYLEPISADELEPRAGQ